MAAWLPPLALTLLLGVECTFTAIVLRAFEGIGRVDAASRATLLAQSISEVAGLGTLVLVLSLVLYVASAILFALGTARVRARHRADDR